MSANGAPAASPVRGPSRAAARVVYNVADAWIPPAAGRPGGGDVDLVPALAAGLREPRERLVLELLARILEWEPRVTLRSRRGFAWLPREARAAQLARWERSRLPLRRRAAAWLRERVEAAYGATLAAAAARAPAADVGAPHGAQAPGPARSPSSGGTREAQPPRPSPPGADRPQPAGGT